MKPPSRPPIHKSHFTSNTLVNLLRSGAEQHLQQLAYRFIQGGETEVICITYGELDRRTRASGAWLEASDARGKRALLLYPPALGDYKP